MESTDSSAGPPQPNLPPGFRFHPTDEELVVHYLKKKINSSPLPVSIIAEVDLYKFDPWELPAKATFGEQEWYFFSPRERKYPNGARPNRAATSGYWKATGTDKPVLAAGGNNQKVGVKKALVFYGGKPPKGIKTNWIMHEYRLAENKPSINKPPGYDLANKKNSLRLDDWVLCRIYKKNNSHRPIDHEREDSMDDMMGSIPPSMRLNLPKLGMNYGALLENDQNLLEGMMANDGVNSTNSSISHLIPSSSSSKPADLSVALKRQTPSSLFWNEDDDQSGISSKRLQFDNSDGTVITRTDNGHNSSSSLATLLSNLPQTPPLHHQNVLGSLGDGLFRAPYQIPGSNWYS